MLKSGIIGGVVNLGVNLIQGNVHGWDALGYFGAGAAAGDLALYGPAGWAAGGAILGASNSALGGAQGWDILTNAVVGGISGVAGGYAGQWAAQSLGGAIINGFRIGSPVVKGVLGGTIGGGVGGYAGGFTGGLLTTGDLSMANKIGLNGLWTGIGGVLGGVSGYKYARENDLDPWSGRPDKSIVIGRNMIERVDPVAKVSGSETIYQEMTEKFPKITTLNKELALEFNSQWINSKINEGYWIYDIGQPIGYVSSPFYNLELLNIGSYNRVYNSFYFNKINTIIYWGR